MARAAALEAEFLLAARSPEFAVFALPDQARAVAENPEGETRCQRLAKLFSASPQGVVQSVGQGSAGSTGHRHQHVADGGAEAQAYDAALDALRSVVMRWSGLPAPRAWNDASALLTHFGRRRLPRSRRGA